MHQNISALRKSLNRITATPISSPLLRVAESSKEKSAVKTKQARSRKNIIFSVNNYTNTCGVTPKLFLKVEISISVSFHSFHLSALSQITLASAFTIL